MDRKAKKILFQTYWQNGGWVDGKNRSISDEDFLYAKEHRAMFDPISISHDDCVSRIHALGQNISQDPVIRAFLASLSLRRLEWRSAVASWMLARRIKPHTYAPVVFGHSYKNGVAVSTHYTCGVCQDWNDELGGHEYYQDEDLSVLNFERIKWGGVRIGDLAYTMFDLEQFQKEDVPKPTDTDIAIFEEILSATENCNPSDFPSALRERLSKIAALKSNKNERDCLIEILASIGVLQPGSYDRGIKERNDWHFVEYWRGEDKYNKETVRQLFGVYLRT